MKFLSATYRSEKSPVTVKRIANIIEYLSFESFRYTCRGLYEEHKFLFVLLITFKIDLQNGRVKPEEFQSFIKGMVHIVFGWINRHFCQGKMGSDLVHFIIAFNEMFTGW